MQGKRLASRNGDLHDRIGRGARELGQCRRDHLAGHGVDGGLAGRERQPGTRDGADARPGAERDAAARRPERDPGADQRPVRHVGIVAGILHYARLGPANPGTPLGQREGGKLAAAAG